MVPQLKTLPRTLAHSPPTLNRTLNRKPLAEKPRSPKNITKPENHATTRHHNINDFNPQWLRSPDSSRSQLRNGRANRSHVGRSLRADAASGPFFGSAP